MADYNYIDTFVGSEINKNPEETNWNNSQFNLMKSNQQQPVSPPQESPTANADSQTGSQAVQDNTLQAPQSAQQPESVNTDNTNNDNPYGDSPEVLDWYKQQRWSPADIKAFHNFDPNAGWTDMQKTLNFLKPDSVDDSTLNKRKTWGAVGDSLKLLTEMASAHAGAHISPDKSTLTDYFLKLNDDDQQKYLDAMKVYNRSLNQAMLQNQKNNYNQYNANQKNLAAYLKNNAEQKQKQSNFETNQSRLMENDKNRQENADRTYNLNAWSKKDASSRGWAKNKIDNQREERLANSSGGGGSNDNMSDFYAATADDDFLETLPESAWMHESNGMRTNLNRSAADRKEIVRRYNIYRAANPQSQGGNQNQYGWNNFNSQYNLDNNTNNSSGVNYVNVDNEGNPQTNSQSNKNLRGGMY